MAHLLRGISSKQDGNLSVRLESEEQVSPKREAFLSRYGIRSQDCVFMEIEHGDAIVHVGHAQKGALITAEAFITSEVGVVLYLLTADCFPVSLYDSEKQVIALAHMGWRPTDKQLAAKVIQEMVSVYGSDPKDIQIYIGPGIHKESYVFTNPSQKADPAWHDFLIDLPTGETQIDLISYIKHQARSSGVPEENIEVHPVDTAASDEFFSHYRSTRTGEAEGRFATILGLV